MILGFKIKSTGNGFSLCQYKKFKMFYCLDVIPVRNNYDPRINLRKNKESSVSQTDYAKLIGSVMFLMN